MQINGISASTKTLLILLLILIGSITHVSAQPEIDIIFDIDVSPDGSKVAVSRGNSLPCTSIPNINRIIILDTVSLDTIITMSGLPCPQYITWSRDSTKIASTGSDGLVRIWDVVSGTEIANGMATTQGGTGVLSWRADDSQIAGALFGAGYFVVYDPVSGIRSDVGLEPPIPLSSLQWHPTDPNIIANGSRDGVVQIRSSDGQLLSSFRVSTQPVTSLQWSADGFMLFFRSRDLNNPIEKIIVVDASTGLQITQIEVNREQYGQVLDVEWSKDSRLIASVSSNGYVSVWNALTGNLVDQIVDPSQYLVAVDMLQLGDNQYQLLYGSVRRDLHVAQLNTHIFSDAVVQPTPTPTPASLSPSG